MSKDSRLVYSTESGRVKEEKHNDAVKASNDGFVRVSRETKGRKGQGVSIAEGFDMDIAQLKKFAKKLKQHCGTGGTVKDGRIEIQGDQRGKIMEFLEKEGLKAKRSGG
ncbi:MAG: stress response translation initiation inhibitor YciH [Agarilytica sp.]